MQYNFTQYKEQAITTLKDHVSKDIAFCDWTLGLVGEAGEVLELVIAGSTDKMEYAKEAGDILWYAAALYHELGITPAEDLFDRFLPIEESAKNLPDPGARILYAQHVMMANASKVAEMMKHRIMHKEKFTVEQIVAQLEKVVVSVNEVLDTFGIDAVDAAQLNVAKLQHRHKGAYSHETSANRHAEEIKFSDTAIYKELEARICGN